MESEWLSFIKKLFEKVGLCEECGGEGSTGQAGESGICQALSGSIGQVRSAEWAGSVKRVQE